MTITTLSINVKQTPIVFGKVNSAEVNSKGAKVNWLRLTPEEKEAATLHTSKDFKEYAVSYPAIEVDPLVVWLAENKELENVKQWVQSLFVAANKAAIVDCAAQGKTEAGLILDVESLVAWETLETARGRKSSAFNADQFKQFLPILELAIRAHFAPVIRDVAHWPNLLNKYRGLAKQATSNTLLSYPGPALLAIFEKAVKLAEERPEMSLYGDIASAAYLVAEPVLSDLLTNNIDVYQ